MEDSTKQIFYYSHSRVGRNIKPQKTDRSIFEVNQDSKMMEDFLFEILPVIGFAMCAASIFILIVMRKHAGTLMFCRFFAVSDLFTGVGALIDGFHGAFTTIYGSTVETLPPIQCFYRSANVPIFLFTDYLNLVILSMFTLDRFIQMSIPVSYSKVRDHIISWKLFFVIWIIAFSIAAPGVSSAFEHRDNTTVKIMSQCRFDDVVGEDFYVRHILTLQWAPIACIALLFATLLLFFIRQTRHKWSYNWSEDLAVTKQLFAVIFIRCFLSALSVHLPLLLIAKAAEGYEIVLLKDHLIRISFWILVTILQPLWYLFFVSPFQSTVFSFFNKYGENTERKWQSADDPPQEPGVHLDRHGGINPFGSWYSMTGNIAGEAGVPHGNERSVSFYYDN